MDSYLNTRIKYEDEDIIVIHKPSGIATETSKLGQADVVSELKNYRKQKGEDTYIGVIHRLDQPVEGLLVFAKNPMAAKKLSSDIQKNEVKKTYYALTKPRPENMEGRLEDYLLKNPKTNLSEVVTKGTKDAKYAALSYKCIKEVRIMEEDAYLMEITIETGRHHQIRTQMAHAGMPLIGDHKYGGSLILKNTALFAGKLSLKHPKTNKNLMFELELPESWKIIEK